MTASSILYTLTMLGAVGAGYLLSRRSQRQWSLPSAERRGVLFGAFCGAMIGAKFPFVVRDWEALRSGAAWFSDGKTILAGLVGGYAGVEAAKWAMHVRVETGDGFAAPVAASVGVGRLACFVGGCCYGTPTSLPWGVVFSHVDALARHPTQLYEAAFHLLAAAQLASLRRAGRFRHQLMKLYILSYLAYRFGSEFIRPEARMWGGLTGYQWACLGLAPVFLWLWKRDAAQIELGTPSQTASADRLSADWDRGATLPDARTREG
ncbi:MAG: prolipoprotein diacylglyceryl transferase [Planctomycetales bacterium]|nr:prolipoprotein diacylglyceryl transferase [Planctomycetales bacterium]